MLRAHPRYSFRAGTIELSNPQENQLFLGLVLKYQCQAQDVGLS